MAEYKHPPLQIVDTLVTVRKSDYDALMALAGEVRRMAREDMLPDGDGMNMPTALWAEDWMCRLRDLA